MSQETTVDVRRTRAELVHCFDIWPGAELVSIADPRDLPDERAVVVFDYIGNRVRCEHNVKATYRSNLRDILNTIDDLRLAHYRGLGDLMMHTVSQMLALPGAAYIDPYELLGVRSDAPIEVVEASYKALAKKAHPDAGGDDTQMRQLNEAIERVRKDRAEA